MSLQTGPQISTNRMLVLQMIKYSVQETTNTVFLHLATWLEHMAIVFQGKEVFLARSGRVLKCPCMLVPNGSKEQIKMFCQY